MKILVIGCNKPVIFNNAVRKGDPLNWEADMPVPEWNSPDSIGVLSAFNEKLQCAVHNVTDRTGRIVAKAISPNIIWMTAINNQLCFTD